uniref:Polymorphic transmembrane cluster 2 transmembrane protein 10 n=1 Tax=Biomphalaria glabrata TaxID=6526 RepID=A0A7G8ZAX6_BIOGL|nr:polymorphic transmembrane cluster 2 transmembrane protein 10 [Biomphalaria glabrata]
MYYGTNTTFEKTFAEPSLVLEECPVNAIVGSEVRCHCIMKGFGSTKAKAKWYKKDNTLISNTSRLAYTLDENDSEFVCEVNMIKLQRSLQTTLNISLTYISGIIKSIKDNTTQFNLYDDPNTHRSNTNNVYNERPSIKMVIVISVVTGCIFVIILVAFVWNNFRSK